MLKRIAFNCAIVGWPLARQFYSRRVGSARKVMAQMQAQDESGPFTVLVEGNIGSGKTTFLQHFKRFEDVTLITEPVQAWRDLHGFNLLELMYRDPSAWAMAFQTYVSVTMSEAHARPVSTPVKLMERSLYSARYCFVENMLRSGTLHEADAAILDHWFNFCCSAMPVRADLIVYLQTTPQVVHERMRRRARSEEQCVPLEYIEQLHELHEDWLIRKAPFACPAPVLVLDADRDLVAMCEEYERSETRVLRRSAPAPSPASAALATSPIRCAPSC